MSMQITSRTIKRIFYSTDKINNKINNYIEKIKDNYFEGSIIEIGIFSNLYDVKISVYQLLNEDDIFYTHYINILKYDLNHNKYLILKYKNGNLFDYLEYKQNKNVNYNINKENKNFY